jgi:hypothetical protein
MKIGKQKSQSINVMEMGSHRTARTDAQTTGSELRLDEVTHGDVALSAM